MIEVIIDSAKYGHEQFDHILLTEGQGEVTASIILKTDTPPVVGHSVIVNKWSEPNYFIGKVENVRCLKKGLYEVYCVGRPRADGKDGSANDKRSKTPLRKR